MYFVLLFLLIVNVYLNYYVYHKDAFTPAGVYSLVLVIAALYGIFWFDKWELGSYSLKATFVILIGVYTFTAVSWIVHYLFCRYPDGKILNSMKTDINNRKYCIMLTFEAITIILAFNFFGGSISNLSQSIMDYRYQFLQGNDTMPNYLGLMLNICLVNGYISGYEVCSKYLIEHNISIKWLASLVLCTGTSLFGGSRGGAVSIIVVTANIFFVILRRKNRYKAGRKLNRRAKLLASLGIILGIVFFVRSAYWIGRLMEYGPAYYFAIYLSAPLKNLELNIASVDAGLQITGSEFRSINGLSLGNVGTIYTYEYIAGGIVAVIVISAFVGLISAFLYEIVRVKNIYANTPSFLMIIYSYIFYCVSMNIFGTTMVNGFISVYFLKIVLGVALLLILYGIQISPNGKLRIKRAY